MNQCGKARPIPQKMNGSGSQMGISQRREGEMAHRSVQGGPTFRAENANSNCSEIQFDTTRWAELLQIQTAASPGQGVQDRGREDPCCPSGSGSSWPTEYQTRGDSAAWVLPRSAVLPRSQMCSFQPLPLGPAHRAGEREKGTLS